MFDSMLNKLIGAAALTLLLSVVAGCDADAGAPRLVSRTQFERIQPGMSYDQVVSILGSPGSQIPDQDDDSVRTFTWPTSSNADTIAIQFADNQVSVKIPPINRFQMR